MDVLSRSQFQKILNIGKVRTMNDILSSMSSFLNHTRMHENIYYLSKKGRDYVGTDRVIKKTMQMEHKLMRNDVRIYYDYPADWRNEVEQKMTIGGKKKSIVADAVFTLDGTMYFVEIDNEQKMINNKRKIDFYKDFFRLAGEKLNKECVLIFYTNTELRRKQLYDYGQQQDVTIGVFTRADLQ
jgi:Replication-relaxation